MSVDNPSTQSAAPAVAEKEAVQSDDHLAPGSALVIGLLLVSAFVVILNETIMSVALPTLIVDLSITASTAQWLTTGFMLTMAVVIPVTGFVLQRFNLRPVFIAAMTLFSAGTLLAALAPGFEVLLAGRVVQASGTAIMMPLLMTTVMNLVPVSRRGRMMGTISIVIAVAPAIGPTISGVILDALDWRWMFWIVLPISLAALTLGAALIKNVTTPLPITFDVFSVIVSAIAFGGIIYGLSSFGAQADGNQPVSPWIPLGVGVLALVVFVFRQTVLQRIDTALLDLRTFTDKNFAIAIALMAVSMMALFGSLIILPLYLQNVRGLDTLETGLLLLPGGVVMGVLSPFVGRLFDRFGPRPLVIPAALVVAAALWLLTTLNPNTSIAVVVVIHSLLMAGLAMMFTPLLTSALGSLRPDLYSHGSAIVGTVQQLAGAAGTAVFVTLLSRGTVSALASGDDGVDATAHGVHTAFIAGAVISTIAVVLALFVRSAPQPAAAPEVTTAH